MEYRIYKAEAETDIGAFFESFALSLEAAFECAKLWLDSDAKIPSRTVNVHSCVPMGDTEAERVLSAINNAFTDYQWCGYVRVVDGLCVCTEVDPHLPSSGI